MVDWKASMQQSFEFYTVDPTTWKDDKPLKTVKSCTINRDSEAETLGSATFDIDGQFKECYVRVYLVTTQNGVTERHPLGTFLVHTPSSSFDGKVKSTSMDAYTPLLELKEKQPPIGFSLSIGENIMKKAQILAQENMRGVVLPADSDTDLTHNFVAESDETWLTYLTALIANDKKTFYLDEMGRVLFNPIQETAALQPVETFDDSNSSILYPEVTIDHDIYGIPNVVEVVCSTGTNSFCYKAINDDPNSPTSTVSRGRTITHRVTDPEISGVADEASVKAYAIQLLKDLSTVEYTISYTHGYCPVRLGDCVRLNYTRAGIYDVKAKVVSQSIQCVPGCPVTEKAVFATSLWAAKAVPLAGSEKEGVNNATVA